VWKINYVAEVIKQAHPTAPYLSRMKTANVDLAGGMAMRLAAQDQRRRQRAVLRWFGWIITAICLALALNVIVHRAWSGEMVDWNRIHAQEDACREQDRIELECMRGLDYCDELSLRRAKRVCSPFRSYWKR
jgi:hypothetical protein